MSVRFPTTGIQTFNTETSQDSAAEMFKMSFFTAYSSGCLSAEGFRQNIYIFPVVKTFEKSHLRTTRTIRNIYATNFFGIGPTSATAFGNQLEIFILLGLSYNTNGGDGSDGGKFIHQQTLEVDTIEAVRMIDQHHLLPRSHEGQETVECKEVALVLEGVILTTWHPNCLCEGANS